MAGHGINGGMTAAQAGVPGTQNYPSGGANPGDPLGGLRIPGYDPTAMERSMKDYFDRPENKEILAGHQNKEYRRAQRINRKMKALEFKDKVLSAPYEAQKNVAPFLESRTLRKIVQSMTNDMSNDFAKWATNPLVIRALTAAKEQLDKGQITEDQMEHNILSYFNSPVSGEAHEEFKRKTRQFVRLDTKELCSALNEQVEERTKGNQLFRARKFDEARNHYERAMSICTFVKGISKPDQMELDECKVLCQLNLAAVCIAKKEYGEAIKLMTDSHETAPRNVKVLLRRAKAYIGRHEYKAAKADLELVKDIEPFNWEAEEEMARLRRMIALDKKADKALCQSMFLE